jgi:hypothetical protein
MTWYNLTEARRRAEAGQIRSALGDLKMAARTTDGDLLDAVDALAREILTASDGRQKQKAEGVLREIAASRYSLARTAFGLTVDLAFESLERVDVALASGSPQPALRVQREAETLLFALYAARQLSNLEPGESVSVSLAEVLFLHGTPSGLAQLMEVGPGDLRVYTPAFVRLKKGFRAQITYPHEISRFGTLAALLSRVAFRMEVKGFPPSGEGLGYFAPASVLALLYFLARRRADDADFLARLGFTCCSIAAAGAEAEITVTNQALPALDATVTAWSVEDTEELFDQLDEPEGDSRAGQEPIPHGSGLLAASSGDSTDPALMIARQRYAQGDITREEFLQIRADLA